MREKFEELVERIYQEFGEELGAAGEDDSAAGEEVSAAEGVEAAVAEKAAAAAENDAAEPMPAPMPAAPTSSRDRESSRTVRRGCGDREGEPPFIKGEASSAASGKGRVKTMPVPKWHGETLKEQAEAGDNRIHKLLRDLPYPRGAAGESVASLPSLTVPQYVSLRADLLTRPDATGETLRRYEVPSMATWRALEVHWREQLVARAELRAEFAVVVGAVYQLALGRGEVGSRRAHRGSGRAPPRPVEPSVFPLRLQRAAGARRVAVLRRFGVERASVFVGRLGRAAATSSSVPVLTSVSQRSSAAESVASRTAVTSAAGALPKRAR